MENDLVAIVEQRPQPLSGPMNRYADGAVGHIHLFAKFPIGPAANCVQTEYFGLTIWQLRERRS